ncbi:MAG: hypothetical protein J5972_04340 [Eubacterium sp.]|nr:hypothetical protein [Eubacterium sp.]
MSIKEYVTEIVELLEKELGGYGYSILTKEIQKNNGIAKNAVILKREGEVVSPTIYLDYEYELYEKGIRTAEDAVQCICDSLDDMEKKSQQFSDVNNLFDNWQEKIVYRLISTKLNEQLLQDIPSIPFLDLSICFYLVVDQDEKGVSSAVLTNDWLERLDTNVKELYHLAEVNTPRLFPMKLELLSDLLIEHFEQQLPDDISTIEQDNFYILTNEVGVYGATVLLYQDVIADLANQEDDDLYLLPSSVHEFLVLPASQCGNIKEFHDMVKEINHECVVKEEWLSNHAYLYKKEEKKFFF